MPSRRRLYSEGYGDICFDCRLISAGTARLLLRRRCRGRLASDFCHTVENLLHMKLQIRVHTRHRRNMFAIVAPMINANHDAPCGSGNNAWLQNFRRTAGVQSKSRWSRWSPLETAKGLGSKGCRDGDKVQSWRG